MVANGVMVYVKGRRPHEAMPAAMLVMFASATPQLKKRSRMGGAKVVEQPIADVAHQQHDALILVGQGGDLGSEGISHAQLQFSSGWRAELRKEPDRAFADSGRLRGSARQSLGSPIYSIIR